MTREEWAADLERRARDAEQLGALAPVAGVLRTVCAELGQVDGFPSKSEAPDTLLTLAEAAERLHVPRRWLTDHRHELPFVKQLAQGGHVRVSEKGLNRWLATR